MKINIRYAQLSDYSQIESILKQVHEMHVMWRSDVYKMNDVILAKDRFLNYIAEDNCIVAEDDGVIVGMVYYFVKHVSTPVHVEKNILYIDTMAVHENYRGKGIGTAMFDHLREIAKCRDCVSFELSVNGKNEKAMKMYEKYGFGVKSLTLDMPLG
ncbi:MAG: GNAT family N-acetyltransferase [Eubacteriaceae bacterium]|nr:GNAT family N-acetyltransferase [Eubacteriaceae bacterium]